MVLNMVDLTVDDTPTGVILSLMFEQGQWGIDMWIICIIKEGPIDDIFSKIWVSDPPPS